MNLSMNLGMKFNLDFNTLNAALTSCQLTMPPTRRRRTQASSPPPPLQPSSSAKPAPSPPQVSASGRPRVKGRPPLKQTAPSSLPPIPLAPSNVKRENGLPASLPQIPKKQQHLQQQQLQQSAPLPQPPDRKSFWDILKTGDDVSKMKDPLNELFGLILDELRSRNVEESVISNIGKIKVKEEVEEEKAIVKEREEGNEDDDENIRPRKKIKLKLETEPEFEPDNAEESEIPSVYRPENPSALQDIDMGKLMKDADQLGLYDDEKARLKYKDEEEFLKCKFAVASFPKNDLQDMLPGVIPMTDFSGPKPTQQVAWNSWLSYIEPFFRNFNDEDLKFLKSEFIAPLYLSKYLNIPPSERKSDTLLNPNYIPPLGPKYSEVWSLENEGKNVKVSRLSQSLSNKLKKLNAGKGNSENLPSSIEEPDKVSCGPLTSRIISGLVDDDDNDFGELFHEMNEEETINFEKLESRLNLELKYIGIFMNVIQTLNDDSWEQDWSLHQEDDEICFQLRKLQNDLHDVEKKNNFRKSKIIPIIEEHIAWQEYISIVDDLDKQVEQYYRRRINVLPRKHKKKNHNHDEKDEQVNIVSNASFKGLLDKRSRWIEKIGSLFKSNLEMRRMPSENIFKENEGEPNEEENEDSEEENDEEEEEAENDDDEEQEEENDNGG